jgi:hypothetical protein
MIVGLECCPYVAAQTVDPTAGAVAVANNLRIASISIAAYDYLITLPAEYRLYKNSSKRSLGFILFVLIRYTSMIVIIVSNTGFFYKHFSANTCAHYFHLAPFFKVSQVMVSQAILGIRTYNIAQRNVWIGRILIPTYLIAVVFQWFTDLHDRFPQMTNGNCTPGSSHPHQPISAWTFYLTAMLYDCLVLSISTVCLFQVKAAAASAGSKMLKILMYDVLGYFVALTAVNMVNVFLYRGAPTSIQSSGASLGYAITWIMSQRILIHLREANVQRAPVAPSQLPTTNTTTMATSAVHYDEETKPYDSMDRNLTADLRGSSDRLPSEFDVEVRIDRSILMGLRSTAGEHSGRALYANSHSHTQRSVWDRAQGRHV